MSAPDFSSFGLALQPVPDFDGWFRGAIVDVQAGKEQSARVRVSPAAKDHHVFVGALDDDQGHRIYVTPPLSPREVVQAFGVGGHGGHSAETADRDIGKRLEAANAICPFVITFADSAGLHAEFTRPLDKASATRIEALWDADAAFADGLEGYAGEWSGDGPLMAPTLVAEQGLRLWWD